jgi:hypothetical protein
MNAMVHAWPPLAMCCQFFLDFAESPAAQKRLLADRQKHLIPAAAKA